MATPGRISTSWRHRREKRRYEAETAYLPLYQELCNAAEAKTAIGNPDGMRSKAESHTPTMTWTQVREMAECGMEIASHGVKEQNGVCVATFAEAASFAASEAPHTDHIPDE